MWFLFQKSTSITKSTVTKLSLWGQASVTWAKSELAGCDRLTIAPALLKELAESEGAVERKLSFSGEVKARPERITESEFLWQHNQIRWQ